ncbi:hypothetical protein B0H16DRAFT_1697380 [Mycena metata]|uniref:Integrase core domain-containing protein n=1 Tax=Mycena metata TaxID=1033252 RepID=A0AAD7HUR5_9AGAR|nr:hypothetical protein B0H16DRAFT_1697380 [Mycena metata]
MRKNDKDILQLLCTKHLNGTRYGMGLTRFREMREAMGLFRSRKEGNNIESIRLAMIRLRAQRPLTMFSPCLIRRARRLKRKRFWAAGVNDLWTVDQHDKWKYKFGLCLHSGLDPFIGRFLWEKDWWTNSNPRLILSYYLDAVEESGFMPLVSQSDPGVENFGLANGNTPAQVEEKKNVMPEIGWSQLRHRWTPGFEDILEIGTNNGWYDRSILLQALVFRWVFIPWLQRELDAYRDRVNNPARRADRNKVLPHGIPNQMYKAPEDFGVLDFKIKVDPAAIAYVRNLYAPPDHKYEDDLALIPNLTPLHNGSEVVGPDGYFVGPDGYYYMGGVNNGLGLNNEQSSQLGAMMDRDDRLPEGEMELVEGDQLVAWFSDEEEEPGDEIFY